MEKVVTEEELEELGKLIDASHDVVVCIHVGPDGDAIGSSLFIKHWLERKGKCVTVIAPNRYPDFLGTLPGADAVRVYAQNEEELNAVVAKADLIVVADVSDSSRLNNLAQPVTDSKVPKVMIDHHLNPEPFCDITVSQPHMCATGEILCHLLHQMGELDTVTAEEAECLYVAMMCDTGAFSYNSNRAEVFECVCHLLRHGIDKDEIYRKVFWTWSSARLKLTGYMLYAKMEMMPKLHAAIMSLSNEERRMLGTQNGDTEGIVNMPLQVKGIKLSVLLSEDTEHEGVVKVSMRSVGDVKCNEICSTYFNGGGHKNASGGRLCCTMEEALEKTRNVVREMADVLKNAK